MTTHEDVLARVRALRTVRWETVIMEDGSPSLTVVPEHEATLDHLEDVFTRHAPERFAHVDVGPRCMEPCDMDWPCPDYASALALLDALDGGTLPRSVYPATPGAANVALDDGEDC